MADLTLLRRDLAAFAAAIGCPLTAWQAGALTLETRTTAILANRQSGKSRSLAVLALWSAFRRSEVRVLIVSAGEEASRRLLAEVRRIASRSPLLRGSLVDEQAGLLSLTNGSEVRSVPASERQVRGWTVDLLLIDEAALVSDDVALSAALPTTAARPEARVVLASSPWAEGGFFHSFVHAGDSEHSRVHTWRLEDCTWISAAAIEAARAAMSPARFAAEYEGKWSGSGDALFSRAVLERCAADFEPPALSELAGPARLLGGCDWGVTFDRSAFAAVARLPVAALNPGADPAEPVFVVCCSRTWPAGEPLSNVVSEVAASPAHFAMLASETVGVGAGPTQELFRLVESRPRDSGGGRPGRLVAIEERAWSDGDRSVVSAATGRPIRGGAPQARGFTSRKLAVSTDAAIKAHAYERLRWLADRGQLVIPREGELLRELAALRIELRPGGAEKIEAGRGHDDLADSLMLAAGPWRERRGRVRCVLGDLAARPRREATVPPLDEPTVETGAGLRLHRRPGLQSVAGPELTLPPGARLRADPHLAETRAAVTAALDREKEAHRG